MKAILIALLLISSGLYSQQLHPSPYQYHMDSLASIRTYFDMRLKQDVHRNNILRLTPYRRYKLTITSLANFSKNTSGNPQNLGSLEKPPLENIVDEYLSLGKWDFMVKLRVNNVRILARIIVSGLNTEKYSYQSGLIFKF
jgi:hypothetical protein